MAGGALWRRLGSVLRWTAMAVGSLLLLGVAANAWVLGSTRDRIYDDAARLPVYDFAVVLGTSPYTHTGNPNALFSNRMKAAARLYHDGHVRHLLVSGANPSRAYNEPRKMYQSLRRRGVPDSTITLDYAGFRTLDSIVRARQIFGLRAFVIVSQRYHEYRALFLAQHEGIEAVGYTWPAEDRRQPLRTEAREYFARIKAVLDLYVLHTRPRFLGPARPIDLGPSSAGGYIARAAR
ncbi:vancomycin high temperature exclusion protein [Salinisphaera sp. LB1]|uniref:SanA/YdcF family protein n=1 Tax=Salinisphaera sp. LB1 TaxID=2183911 RepID=UPI000D7066F2|nr:ElyC/SanA/YdcF family protein [Salinisphaera sp. LB1]AWN14577.1 SanA protein [Salinisphaera sp. LB1]